MSWQRLQKILRAACKDNDMDKKMDTEDKKKFEEMYLDFQLILKKMAYINDIPFDYIDDVVQDTFVSYARYDYPLDLPPDNKRMLLIKILKSRCMDFHRKMKRRSYGELDEEMYNSEDFPSKDRGGSLPDFIVSKERCQALLAEIEKMPENWRGVATLKLIQGRPTREVCDILNITEKACYSRVSRIRRYLETLLQDENWP